MAYRHIDIEVCQSPKRAGDPCGDVVATERTAERTMVVLSDGIGSGVKAHLAATMCTSRLLELLRMGYSLREAFRAVVRTMNQARGSDLPYAVFTVVQVLSDGAASALSYEIPPPIFVGPPSATVLNQKRFVRDQAVIFEANCLLDAGDGLLAVSDGVTQAGLGAGLPRGWEIEGVCRHVSDLLARGRAIEDLPDLVHRQAQQLWRNRPGTTAAQQGDDISVVALACRPGKVVSIFTGPPVSPVHDKEVAGRFLASEGVKVVCGATTARIVAARLGQAVRVVNDDESLVAPPRCVIDGIDLVTEGAVTLNQAYNLLDADVTRYHEDSGVTRLCGLVREADRVNFIVGRAANVSDGDLSFKQQGILPRTAIVPLIADKLRARGKLVVVDWR